MASGSSKRRVNLAVCAVAFAAAVGGGAQSVEASAVRKIEHYCAASWRNAGIHRQDWGDCTQQALVELLDLLDVKGLARAIETSESDERRELNRAVWRTIQRWRRAPRPSRLEGTTCEDHATDSLVTDELWRSVIRVADECLTTRQRDILLMSRDGWRVREIADRLSLSAARVSDEKYKAISKLRQRLLAGDA